MGIISYTSSQLQETARLHMPASWFRRLDERLQCGGYAQEPCPMSRERILELSGTAL